MESSIVPAKPGDIVIYQSEQGQPEVECVFQDENLWLLQANMAELYQVAKSTLSEHIKHILDEGELERDSVVRNSRTTASDNKNYQVTVLYVLLKEKLCRLLLLLKLTPA